MKNFNNVVSYLREEDARRLERRKQEIQKWQDAQRALYEIIFRARSKNSTFRIVANNGLQALVLAIEALERSHEVWKKENPKRDPEEDFDVDEYDLVSLKFKEHVDAVE